MMTVNEVSKLAGVSIRTLQYYDSIGLLKPAEYTESGYRLYDDAAMERLQQILLFRELEFPLKEIKEIITRPDFDKQKALEQQIELLTMKKKHLENLIQFARGIQNGGNNNMDFTAFDTSKLEEYTRKAKEQWGDSKAFSEYEQKSASRSKDDEKMLWSNFMKLFEKSGKLKDSDPKSAEAQAMVKDIQNYITQNFYKCTNEILAGLGKMYAADGEFKTNIDKAGGNGTAEFVSRAIAEYVK
ncbi:DNA-binding transcriptional regulator, MerR family [Pseudobutyrivibrio ruminis]|uniref:DNA-binding transcriptional regulator, MerR family n=1 Tax=Pseudobutyrivibrio ruminis TaxID=46206 RepID=A0A1H7J3D1_9FIRM|nr:MerR family transcriptional regulator [Pseudobutyrivibrio ruminis]SEK68914.1 DNA-binding transcriptional regulator, MerR family [Pseudobutyrivibrio ruminis]